MSRYGNQKPVRFDESELKTDLGNGNYIFVGSSCDLFAKSIPDLWINKTLKHMENFNNKYLIQSKDPDRILDYIHCTVISEKTVICTTIESDSYYPLIMKDSPHPMSRSIAMQDISEVVDTYVTIEPILDFHLEHMVKMIKRCNPKQVNIGADSGNNNLPEPPKEKILELIDELKKFTTIDQKRNLGRLLKPRHQIKREY
jgi:protein gp37